MRYLALFFIWALSAPVLADDLRVLTVTGVGEVIAVPDQAVITMGVTAEAKTAADALAANAKRSQRMIAGLKAAGIAPRDLQTSQLSLQPRWQHYDGVDRGKPPKIVGYVVSNQVSVRVRELSGLGGLLDVAVSDGGNTFQGLRFGLQNPRPVVDEARRAAVKDALAKAKLYAEAAGVVLGSIQSISEAGGGNRPRPMQEMAMARMASDAMPVEAGELTMDARVTVVIRLAD